MTPEETAAYFDERAKEGNAELASEGPSVAKQLYDAVFVQSKAEDRVCAVLSLAFREGWENYSADYYDESIEVFGPNLTAPEAPDVLRRAGFKLAWLHAPGCEMPRGNDCKCPPIRLTGGAS
jgi:hypothetical protein